MMIKDGTKLLLDLKRMNIADKTVSKPPASNSDTSQGRLSVLKVRKSSEFDISSAITNPTRIKTS